MSIIHVTFNEDADKETIAKGLIDTHAIVQNPLQKERFEKKGILSGEVKQTGNELKKLLKEIGSVEGVKSAQANPQRGHFKG